MNSAARATCSMASVLLAAGLLVSLPYVVGVGWEEVWERFGTVSPLMVAGLFAIWAAGLAAYTFVLTASLPGLTHRRAFMLNAAGSAVSNLLPFGGAVGVAATFAIARGWGFGTEEVTVSTLISGIWNVLARLLLPALGIVALLAIGVLPGRELTVAAATACATLVGITLVAAAALRWEYAARQVDQALGRAARRLPKKAGDLLRLAGSSLLRIRTRALGVLSAGWTGLTGGIVAYFTLQAVLLAACLHAAGATVRPAETFAVFAINRVLTSAVVTPGGSGITETGSAALLVHLGVEAAPAATAVLLYSFFTHLIEIPVGGLVWVYWLTRGRARGRRQDLPQA